VVEVERPTDQIGKDPVDIVNLWHGRLQYGPRRRARSNEDASAGFEQAGSSLWVVPPMRHDPASPRPAVWRPRHTPQSEEVTMTDQTFAWAAAIREREAVVRAFAWVDLERARHASAAAPPGPLRGRWVGIKDVIDTAGIPTERGSALFRGRVPERSATLVTRIEAAGGVVAGKTVTAELALFTPGPTTNSWDPTRTPGGSSMGSAAAVAAGMLPLATGTQTSGSIIRPAAFCGVVGFKPSFGMIPRDGVMLLSDTLDHLGGFATTVADVAELCSVMAGSDLRPRPLNHPPRLGVYRSPEWPELEPAAREQFDLTIERLDAAGATIEEAAAPRGFDAALLVQRNIMVFETARNRGADVARAPELVSDGFRRTVANGQRLPEREYLAALADRERLIVSVIEWAGRYDGILNPPALGQAPGLETTGDPRLCVRWTLVGAPAVSLPSGAGPAGLPLGLQVCGPPGSDRALMDTAAWVESALAVSV
jgi:Asp-tRNA(Asn)/Glu-tRNA(Gln) amidotransferase A subunit family amidase